MELRTDGATHRKRCIMLRIQHTMHRLSQAKSQKEYAAARRWVNAWSGAIQAKIAKLQAQAEAVAHTKSIAALEKIRGLMEKHSVTVAHIEAFVGKRRGRKPQAGAAAKQSTSTAKYADPKTGATWTGHGRAPAWIANAKDRTKFLVAGGSAKSAAAAKEAPKAGNYVRGIQPALYRYPKTGATWSGRGRAPAWIASAKDRSKFLIAKAQTAVKTKSGKASSVKTATAKKATSENAVVTEVAAKTAKKVAAKKSAGPARKTSTKNGVAAKARVARKARVPKSVAKSAGPVETTAPQATTEGISTLTAA